MEILESILELIPGVFIYSIFVYDMPRLLIECIGFLAVFLLNMPKQLLIEVFGGLVIFLLNMLFFSSLTDSPYVWKQ